MAKTDARPVPKKNVAYRHYFAIRKSDGTLITSWTGQDSELSNADDSAFADVTNEATEIGTSGCGYIDLTSTEMNVDVVMLKITVTNAGALPYVVTLYPEEIGDIRADITAVAGQTASASSGVTFPASIGTSTYAGADTSGTTTLLSRLTSTRAGYMDQLEHVSDHLDSILSDTNEMQTELANGGRLDLLIDGIKAKTDYLPSATAGQAGGVFIAGTNAATTVTTAFTATFTGNLTGNVGGSVASISGITFPTNFSSLSITESGLVTYANAAPPSMISAADIRAAIGLASANVDTQLANLPTVAEFEARTLLAADYVVAADTVNANVLTWLSVTPLALSSQKVQADASVSLTEENVSDIAAAVAAAVSVSGNGSVAVTHNYGSTNSMKVVDSSGNGVDDVTINAYLKSQYDAGSVVSIASTTTTVDGVWSSPLYLDPGAYYIVFSKPGSFQSYSLSLVVS